MRDDPKPETAADLGHVDLGDRLASLNWFAVKAVLGVLVRSLAAEIVRSMNPDAHLQPLTGASDDSKWA